MLRSNCALMSAQQPSFQQCDHAMDARKQVLAHFLMALYLAFMDVSFQSQISPPAVGSDRASRRNCLSNKPVQAGLGHVWNAAKTNAPYAIAIFLGSDDDQELILCLPSDYAGFLSPQ